MMRRPRILAGAIAIAMGLSCGGAPAGDGGSSPPTGPKTRVLSIVQSKTATDTIEAIVGQNLTVEVRDPTTGALRPNVEVRFEAIDYSLPTGETAVSRASASSFSRVVVDTTDASGRARASVQLGTHVGSRRVVASSLSLGGADTATYVTLPGAMAGIRAAPQDTAVFLDHTVRQGANALDRAANPTPTTATISTSTPNVCSIDTDGTVHGRDYGFCLVDIASGTLRAKATIRVVPDGIILVRTGGALGMLSLDGSGFTKIVDVDSLSVFRAQWLTSGREVAFLEKDGVGSHLVIAGLDGAKQTFASLPFAIGRQQISDDGLWIASVTESSKPFSSSIVRIRRDGTGLQYAGQDCCDFSYATVAISPDGGRVAYGDYLFGSIATFVGGLGKSIGSFESARFSMDGTQIATATGAVFAGPVTGGGALRNVYFSQSSSYHSIAGWSPDSKWLLLSSTGFTVSWAVMRVSDGMPVPLVQGIGSKFVVVGGWKP